MATQFTYTIADDTANGLVDEDALVVEIGASSITIALDTVGVSGPDVVIDFKADLSGAEETTLDGILSAHAGEPIIVPDEVHVSGQPAFADKTTSDGKSLFRRVHGVKKTLSGDTTFDLVIPYDQCKINAIEIVWAPAGLQADLKVYDTPTGTITAGLPQTGYTAINKSALNFPNIHVLY